MIRGRKGPNMGLPRVLIVDDSSTVRVQLRRTLMRAGYEVVLAANGRAGLAEAQQQPPDLVILDIQMPDIDGYTVCQELKRMGSPLNTTPIIFLTSLESHALSLLGSEMGAYLKKPVRPDDLLAAVGSFVPRPQDVQLAVEQAAEPSCVPLGESV
jgi:DNA-binding response OmpR family regulator